MAMSCALALFFLYSNIQQQENMHLLNLIESAQNLTSNAAVKRIERLLRLMSGERVIF
jgi:hypothetical protein